MSKKKTTRASKTVPSFIRDSGRHVCNDLISRVFRRVRVFLLCAFERQKNSLAFQQKKQLKKKTKNFSLLFFPPFFSKRSPLQKISAYFNRDEEGGDEEQTRKNNNNNNNNNNEDVGSREGVLPLYELANLFVARVRNVHVVRCVR